MLQINVYVTYTLCLYILYTHTHTGINTHEKKMEKTSS